MAERTEHTDELFRAIEDIYPLTPVQEGMLFHTVLEPGSQAYLSQSPGLRDVRARVLGIC